MFLLSCTFGHLKGFVQLLRFIWTTFAKSLTMIMILLLF
jgi:hypothetical protein